MEHEAEKSGGKLKRLGWFLGFLVFIGILALASTKPPELINLKENEEQTKVIFEEPFVLHFSEIMNKRSVQSAFSITPKIAGKFQWPDAQTMEFHPENSPKIGNEYQIKIKDTAQSLWFKKMEEEAKEDFLITGPPSLIFKSPENKSSWGQDKAITVMFDQPMAFDKMDFSKLIKTEPKLEGEMKVIGLSALQFIPKNIDLKAAYKVELVGSLPAVEGGKTQHGVTWTIEPSANEVLQSSPEQNEESGLNQKLEIEFSQPIELANIQPGKNVQLFPSNDLEETKNDGFFNTEVRYAEDENGVKIKNRLIFTPSYPFKERQTYQLILKSGESMNLAKDFELSFITSENPEEFMDKKDSGEDEEFSFEWSEVQKPEEAEGNPVFLLRAKLKNGLPASKLEGNYFLYRKALDAFYLIDPQNPEISQLDCFENCPSWEKVTEGEFKFSPEGQIRMGLEENAGELFKEGYEYRWGVKVKNQKEEPLYTFQDFEIPLKQEELPLGTDQIPEEEEVFSEEQEVPKPEIQEPDKNNLELKPVLPENLSAEDETLFSVWVKNNFNATLNTKVTLKAEEVAITSATQNFILEPGQEKKLNFNVKVNSILPPELKTINVEFTSGKSHTLNTIDIQQQIVSMDLISDTFPEGISSLLIRPPEGLDPEAGKLNFMLSLSPGGILKAWTEALNKEKAANPYLQAVQIIVASEQNLTAEEKAVLKKEVLSLASQMSNPAGFKWTKNGPLDPSLTAMAILALSKAKEAGIKLNETGIKKSLTYLLSILEKNQLSAAENSFILWVLSEEGQYDTEKALRLYKTLNQNDIVAKSFLLLNLENLHQAGQKSTIPFIQSLKKEIVEEANKNKNGLFFEVENGDKIIPTALVTYALAHLDPENPVLPELVNYLVQQKTDFESNLNPSQALWTILALQAFIQREEEGEIKISAQIKLNGEILFNRGLNRDQIRTIYEFSKSTSFLDKSALNHLLVKKEGKGKLYLDLHWTGTLQPQNMKQDEQGAVLIKKIYVANDPEKKPVQSLMKGTEYISQLLLVIPHELIAVKVEMSGNGGVWLKPENPEPPFELAENSQGDLVYFAPHLSAGVYLLESKLEPLITGIYHQFPSHLESMSQEIFTRTEGEIIRVTSPSPSTSDQVIRAGHEGEQS